MFTQWCKLIRSWDGGYDVEALDGHGCRFWVPRSRVKSIDRVAGKVLVTFYR